MLQLLSLKLVLLLVLLQAPERLEMLQLRCLEVCASYPEFWLRCARQRQKKSQEDMLKLLEFGASKVLKRRSVQQHPGHQMRPCHINSFVSVSASASVFFMHWCRCLSFAAFVCVVPLPSPASTPVSLMLWCLSPLFAVLLSGVLSVVLGATWHVSMPHNSRSAAD